MSKKSTYITDKSLKTQTITAIVMIILPLIIVAVGVLAYTTVINSQAKDLRYKHLQELKYSEAIDEVSNDADVSLVYYVLKEAEADEDDDLASFSLAYQTCDSLKAMLDDDQKDLVPIIEETKGYINQMVTRYKSSYAAKTKAIEQKAQLDEMLPELSDMYESIETPQSDKILTKTLRLLVTGLEKNPQGFLIAQANLEEAATTFARLRNGGLSGGDYTKARTLTDDFIALAKDYAQNNDQAYSLMYEVDSLSYLIYDNSVILQEKASAMVWDTADDIQESLFSTRIMIMLGVLISALFIWLITKVIIRKVINPIRDGISTVTQLSEGNLDLDVEKSSSNDEIGQFKNALYTLNNNMRDIVSNISDTAASISQYSNEMTKASQEMSENANNQASSSEELSSSVEEIAASIQQNSENAQETERIANKNSDTIQSCFAAAQQTVKLMNEIASKISIIDEIAFQTNILALNAAVEAARAGESGKGFAVVAAEVRKLAEKCATSARDIDLVSNQGKQVAKQTGEAFSQVLPEIERTTQLVKEIAISSSEQAANSNHINLGVQNFNSSTQHVAALSEEVATNCQSLAEMADALTRMIQFFKL